MEMVSPRSFPKNAHSGATMILYCAPPSCHLMCKLCVSWAVRGNPSVSGRTVCIERVSAYAFHHFGSTVLVLTLQYICTIYSVAVSILHPTQLLGVTPHGLKRAVLSSRRDWCVCATAVVVRQWTPSVLHGPSDLSATTIIAL